MKNNIFFWIIALIITLLSAYYQRTTGPTYPLKGNILFNEKEIKYNLDRSFAGDGDCPVKISTEIQGIQGTLIWKRHNTKDADSTVEMRNENGVLTGYLRHREPASKIDYQIRLTKDNIEKYIPSKNSYVVIRFRGDVPAYILIPHILFMFLTMLISTRTGLEVLKKDNFNYFKLMLYTIATLIIGGFILGPLVQKFAFNEYWTGVPFGFDLTDNKTLIAFIGWMVAFIAHYKSKNPKYWILGAAILMLVVYLIPHSVLGSELDYSKVK